MVVNFNHVASYLFNHASGFSGDSDGKESICNVETWVPSLGSEDPLEKGTATY